MAETILRFIIGGAIVTAFAAMGDMLKPKSFAGLFGAAPSVAIATLGLTLRMKGPAYCAIEGRSMIGGAFAFFIYACLVSMFMGRRRMRALQATLLAMPAWGLVVTLIWFLGYRS
jgi:hypothetical protein